MPIIVIVNQLVLLVVWPHEVSTGGGGMPVRGVNSVTGANTNYASDIPIRRRREFHQPLKSEAAAESVLGTGKSYGPGSQAASGLRETIAAGVQHLNAVADIFNKGLHFRIHEETEQIVVEIINKETGEV